MATSTIPAVKAAIFELLRARPGLAGVQIEWDRPSDDAMQHEAMWFLGARQTQKAEAMGNQRRDETFTLELLVSIRRDGNEPQLCELRMWEVIGEIEQLLRQNPKPIPAPLFDVQFAGAEHQPHQAPGQDFDDAVVAIAGRARI